MVNNGQEWSIIVNIMVNIIVNNGQYWPIMVNNGQKWSIMVDNG